MLIVACGKGSGQAAAGPNPTQPAAAPSGSSAPAATAASSSATAPLAQVPVSRAFPALTFSNMTGMYEIPDGSNRFAVTEQAGRIMVFDDKPDVTRASVLLDIRDRVNTDGTEEGLLGLAFAPDFKTSGVFYVDYVARNPVRTVIARFQAGADRTSADPASEQRLLEINQPFPNHKGGQIVFGPDGYLYFGMGDGGSANDPGNRAQDLGQLLGKILRIDVSGSANGLPYKIPPDNPFVGKAGARAEIYSYGMRNPWRFSFDSATGALWVGDVGQNAWEEVDIITKGGNYGWPQLEATHCNSARSNSCSPEGTVLPVTEYPTASPNCAVTGGFVYRAGRIPSLQGAYVYSDYCSGKLWALRYDGSKVTEQAQVADLNANVSSLAMDAAGNLYALDHKDAGGIYLIGAQ
jgi:glucose/arabinose dehydrogenase